MLEKRLLNGGMNLDDEQRLIAKGELTHALNVRSAVSDGSNHGAIENTKGNTLILSPLPFGDNKVIGTYNDKNKRIVIYFVYNSEGNHSIKSYSAITNRSTYILQGNRLNFSSDYLITGISLVDGKLLYWTDDLNEIRHIDIELAVDDPFNGYYDRLNAESSDLTAIVKPSLNAPKATYFDDDRNFNNLKGNIWQFRIQYKYINNQRSSWSPISKVVVPEGESFTSSEAQVNRNNGLKIEFDPGNDFVEKINIAGRVSNIGAFRLIDTVKRSDVVADPNYNFFNDKVLTGIDQDEVSQLQSFIPRKAKSLELIDGNRLAFGNVLDQYDLPEVDASVTPVYRDLVSSENPIFLEETIKPVVSDYLAVVRGMFPTEAADGTLIMMPDLQANIASLENAAEAFAIKSIIGSPQGQPERAEGRQYRIDEATVDQSNAFLDVHFKQELLDEQKGIVQSETTTIIGNASYAHIAGNSHDIHVGLAGSINSNPGSFYKESPFENFEVNFEFNGTKPGFKFQRTAGAGGAGGAEKGVYAVSDVSAIRALAPPGDPNNTDDNPRLLVFPVHFDKIIFTEGGTGKIWTILLPLGQLQEDRNNAPIEVTNLEQFWRTVEEDTTAELLLVTGDTPSKTHKRGATHDFAISYSDIYDRRTTAITDINMSPYVKTLAEMGSNTIRTEVSDTRGKVDMLFNISSTPPEWAASYQILYAGNRNISKTLQLIANEVRLELDKIIFSVQAISDFNERNKEESLLTYGLAKGDRVRMLFHGSTRIEETQYFDIDIDLEVLSYDELTREITAFNPIDIAPSSLVWIKDGVTIEIHTPKTNTDDDDRLYYEIGRSYPILTDSAGNRFHSGDTVQTATAPATVDLSNDGDSYFRNRKFVLTTGVFEDTSVERKLEDFSMSDFYTSMDWDKGRPNRVDDDFRETRRPATVRYTSPFVPNTNINGLSESFDTFFMEYDKNYGSIQHMYSEDKKLSIFQELKAGAVLVNEIVYRDLAGNANVAASVNVLSTIIYYSGEYGIGTYPESFAVYGNNKYFVDPARGAVLRLSSNGLHDISEYKAHNYFTDAFKKVYENPIATNIYGVFDKRFDEYIVSIDFRLEKEMAITSGSVTLSSGNIKGGIITTTTVQEFREIEVDGDVRKYLAVGEEFSFVYTDSQGEIKTETSIVEKSVSYDSQSRKTTFFVLTASITSGTIADPKFLVDTQDTIAFSEKLNKWVTFYSYQPEYMEEDGTDIVTFKDGQIYTHNTNDTYNEFYGVPGHSEVEVVANQAPSNTKFYRSIQMESNEPWEMPEATNQQGQKTSLITEDFERREDHFYAALLKDENTPNVDNPLIEGDDMRSYTLRTRFRNSSEEEVVMFAIGIKFSPSELSNR